MPRHPTGTAWPHHWYEINFQSLNHKSQFSFSFFVRFILFFVLIVVDPRPGPPPTVVTPSFCSKVTRAVVKLRHRAATRDGPEVTALAILDYIRKKFYQNEPVASVSSVKRCLKVLGFNFRKHTVGIKMTTQRKIDRKRFCQEWQDNTVEEMHYVATGDVKHFPIVCNEIQRLGNDLSSRAGVYRQDHEKWLEDCVINGPRMKDGVKRTVSFAMVYRGRLYHSHHVRNSSLFVASSSPIPHKRHPPCASIKPPCSFFSSFLIVHIFLT